MKKNTLAQVAARRRKKLDEKSQALRKKLRVKRASMLRPQSNLFLDAKGKVICLLGLIIVLLLFERCSSREPAVQTTQSCDLSACQTPPSDLGAASRSNAIVPSPSKAEAKPRFRIPDQKEQLWLQSFRRLVASSALGLRKCLPQAASPGALRWSVLLVKTGSKLTEHRFSGMGASPDPTPSETACLIDTLERLKLEDIAFPLEFETQRIALVLEF